MRIPNLAAAFVIALLFARAAAADTVYMKDGRKFEGQVTDQGDKYAIKGKFGTVYVEKKDVDHVDMPPTAEYGTRSKALKDDDPEGHYQLGLWCKEKGMVAEAKAEFERTLKADPNHAGAHRGLGHARVGDRWGTAAEMMDSVDALLRLGKADKAREVMGPLLENAVESLDRPQQARAWKIAVSLELRAGAFAQAADAADKVAELVPAAEKIARKSRAELIRASSDGKYEVKSDDLVAVAPGQTDPGMEALSAGRMPLWDERVMLIALRGIAQRDIDKGKKNVQDGDACATLDKEKALRLYDSSEDFFQHASDIVPDFGRQYLVEAVRKQIPILIELASDNVDKANARNPLDRDYGLQQSPTGKITFTGDGLGRYQSDKRDWNAYAGKVEECYKRINKLNDRFPAEFAQHKKACDELQAYYQKKIPEVRAFLDRVEKALK